MCGPYCQDCLTQSLFTNDSGHERVLQPWGLGRANGSERAGAPLVQTAMASVHSPTDAVQGNDPVSDSAKSLDPPSPASGSPGDDEEPALPEGFGKSFAVRDGDRQGVYIYVPTEVGAIKRPCVPV